MSKKSKQHGKQVEVNPKDVQAQRIRVLTDKSVFDTETYKYDDTFRPGDPSNFHSVHTMPELIACLEKNPAIQAEGTFLEANTQGEYRYRRMNKPKIMESWKKNARLKKFREADSFATNSYGSSAGANSGLVGDDYVPLLGGPFNKQQYFYDYLRSHAYCFQQLNHNPFARAIVNITRDFVLGRGFYVDSEDQKALALWRAFEKANDLEHMMEDIVSEGCWAGENMIWWLPNQEVFISYQDKPGQEPARGLIPRIRLADPSACWEIVTYPEDIKRVLYYQFVYPTQYQMYTGKDAGQSVPSSKFIMQQIPASDMMHFKYNSASNEKRGRSDLFSVLGYLKFVEDCVKYKLVALKKQSAWTEDISIEGSQTDVDALSNALAALGTFESAGSRFIHTDKIKREYMANANGTGGKDETLEWGLNMIAAGTQIPVTYFGLAHSAGQTRASAIVGTEPVAKKFERRQNEVRRIIEALWRKFQDKWGVYGAECKITFSEIITQDRSAKLKDIKMAEDCGYISRATAAPIAAKELDIDNYDYETEAAIIKTEGSEHLEPTVTAPLTAPSAAPPQAATPSSSAVTGDEKHALSMQDK